MNQINTPSGITHKLACAIEKAIQDVEVDYKYDGSSLNHAANEVSMDYKEIEGAAINLLQAQGKEFSEKEKSFFVLLAWYCLRQRVGSIPMQEEHRAA